MEAYPKKSLSALNHGAKKVGLVLSGGGVRGIAHAGVIKALLEQGYIIEEISGTSAGGIVGGLFCYGYNPEEIKDLILNAKLLTRLRPSLRSGLLKLEGFRPLFTEAIGEINIEDLNTPLTINATNLQKGFTEFFKEGKLADIILAGSCVPLVFKPYLINNVSYVDGGLLNNLPVEPLLNGEKRFIIGSHSNPIHHDCEMSRRQIIERSLLLAIQSNTLERQKLTNFMIEPLELGGLSGLSMNKIKEIFEIGYSYTMEQAKEIEIAYFEFKKNV